MNDEVQVIPVAQVTAALPRVKLTLKLPELVGVPVSLPVELRVMPGGRLVDVKTNAPVPPEGVNW